MCENCLQVFNQHHYSEEKNKIIGMLLESVIFEVKNLSITEN